MISTGQQQTLERRSEKLETKLAAGTANDAEQRQLLRLRLALGDQTGASSCWNPSVIRTPISPHFVCCWRISKAKTTTTRERNGRFAKNRQPLHPQALEDYARLQLKLGRKQEVMQQLRRPPKPPKASPNRCPLACCWLMCSSAMASMGKPQPPIKI